MLNILFGFILGIIFSVALIALPIGIEWFALAMVVLSIAFACFKRYQRLSRR